MALLSEVRAFLIAQGVGVSGSTANWAVTMGTVVPTPDRLITLFETGGFQDELHESNPITRPTLQLHVRGAAVSSGYAQARAKVEAAQTALLAVRTGTTGLSGRTYVCLVPQGQPISLGQDANNRPRLVQNWMALRSRTS